MIKFFRHIRQALFNQNRFGKYLLYAFGEIILVVLGILIALTLNTWKEEAKKAEQEKNYLSRLLSDNQQDLTNFQKYIDDLDKGRSTVTALSEAFNDNNTPDSILIFKANEYFTYGSIFPIFASSQSTFEDLSSTGNLTIISNAELRDKIVGHYAEHDRMAERIKIDNDWALALDGPFALQNKALEFEPSTTFLFPKRSTASMAQELRNKKGDYLNYAAAHYWINSDAIAEFEKLLEKTEVLIDSLEKELNQKK